MGGRTTFLIGGGKVCTYVCVSEGRVYKNRYSDGREARQASIINNRRGWGDNGLRVYCTVQQRPKVINSALLGSPKRDPHVPICEIAKKTLSIILFYFTSLYCRR